ncbi:MAG: hypothetical protein RQ826_15815 [Xanthomonadales bacterium]|nr:hypothetical protein [Xanthomonadales bacterium]
MLEAEGRALRHSALRLGLGLGLLILVVMLVTAALGLCLWAVYQYLAPAMEPASATLATAFIALLMAGIVGWVAQRLGR